MLPQSTLPRISMSAPSATARGRASVRIRKASNPKSCPAGLGVRAVDPSNAWATASMPVQAGRCDGRLSVNSGSRIACANIRSSPQNHDFDPSDVEITEVRVTSEPVPAVVGMAIAGRPFVGRGCAANAKSLAGWLLGAMAATSLAGAKPVFRQCGCNPVGHAKFCQNGVRDDQHRTATQARRKGWQFSNPTGAKGDRRDLTHVERVHD